MTASARFFRPRQSGQQGGRHLIGSLIRTQTKAAGEVNDHSFIEDRHPHQHRVSQILLRQRTLADRRPQQTIKPPVKPRDERVTVVQPSEEAARRAQVNRGRPPSRRLADPFPAQLPDTRDRVGSTRQSPASAT